MAIPSPFHLCEAVKPLVQRVFGPGFGDFGASPSPAWMEQGLLRALAEAATSDDASDHLPMTCTVKHQPAKLFCPVSMSSDIGKHSISHLFGGSTIPSAP